MNHKNDLLFRLKELVKEERRITSEVIRLLEIVHETKLFAEMAYGSLFEFCVDELGYSESAAQRRIHAMRIGREIPEAISMIEAGTLSLSNAARIQSFISQQKITDTAHKRELIKMAENSSARIVERRLATLAPLSQFPDRAKPIDAIHSEVRFVAPEALLEKLTRLKCLLAHKNPNYTYAELIDELAELALKKLDPMRAA